jgi:hypothetical protein
MSLTISQQFDRIAEDKVYNCGENSHTSIDEITDNEVYCLSSCYILDILFILKKLQAHQGSKG